MESLSREIETYWDSRAQGYSEKITEDLESGSYRECLKLIEEHICGRTDTDIIDVGTGPGFFPIILGRRGYRVTGIDGSEKMLLKARENCSKYGVRADFALMDAQKLDFPDGSFGLVISRNLMWNLTEPEKAYAEWLRVLRPGGKIILFDSNHYLFLHDPDYDMLDPYRGRDRPGGSAHMNNVDPQIMEDIAKDLPLSRIRRPQWDSDVLTDMGVVKMDIIIDRRDSLRLRRNGDVTVLPFSFFICAEKPRYNE